MDWEGNIVLVGPHYKNYCKGLTDPIRPRNHREHVEPWLSALLQAEHLSLLVGNGLTTAIGSIAGAGTVDMRPLVLDCDFADAVMETAARYAKTIGRESANVEDQVRAIGDFIGGLRVFAQLPASGSTSGHSEKATQILPFASRTASRERLHIFTTNYDRLIEYGCEFLGMRIIDRFVGSLAPVFRSSRLGIDLHYNPPGIRGEPRYLEGVVRLTKLHGSIDWRSEPGFTGATAIRRCAFPFGAPVDHPGYPSNPGQSLLVYPNAAKDMETLEYPYAELFRDFAAAVCQPNSVIVTYGYGFGDDHVNRILRDMLTIPSTHLVIISWDHAAGRVARFFGEVEREEQISLLIGSHFGDLQTLVDHYLPKPAIDRTTWRMVEILERRSCPKKDDDRENTSSDGPEGQ